MPEGPVSISDSLSDSLSDSFKFSLDSLRHVVQALANARWAGQLWLITRGAQAIGEERSHTFRLGQAALWGVGRVLALEDPKFQPVCLDLDPVGSAEEVEQLVHELFNFCKK